MFVYNKRAIEYGRSLTTKELLNEAIKHRCARVSLLGKIPISDFVATPSPQSSYTLSGFLHEMFISHDAHHIEQMERHLASLERG